MALDWVPGLIEKLSIGAVGGISAYWLAQRKFISEKNGKSGMKCTVSYSTHLTDLNIPWSS